MTEPRWLSVEERSLWLKLSGISTLLPTAIEAQLKRDAGVNLFEYYVMAMLSEADEMTRSMTELAFHTNSSLSRLSHVVSRLEQQGWVTRATCKEDGRATNATLTAAGFEKLKLIAPGHVETVREIIFDAITPAQVKQLNKALQPILDSIDAERRTPRS